jgi:hypothetical protein
MRSVRRAVVVACTLVLGACTTEPYKDSIGTFAKGISASQSALVKLDQRNNEIKRGQQLRAQTNLKLGPCNVGSGGCEFAGLTPPKSTIPTALLYMAQLVAYSNGLADLVAAKDTAAIEQASGKINAAAQSSIKSFGTQVGQSATILAALDLVNTVANDIIDTQRVAALRTAVLNNRSRIESAINSLANTSYQLQVEVVGIEKVYLNQQAADFNSSTDPGARQRLAEEISSEQESLAELAKTDARVPFRALLKAHKAVVRALQGPNYSFTDAASTLQDFLAKAQALDAAVKKGS